MLALPPLPDDVSVDCRTHALVSPLRNSSIDTLPSPGASGAVGRALDHLCAELSVIKRHKRLLKQLRREAEGV